jgi:predicted transcriptional regulator
MDLKHFTQKSGHVGKGVEKLLGDLEMDIMRVVWVHESVTVREVLTAVSTSRTLAYTTVMTVMSRLADKGLLNVDRQGKTHTYRAAYTREAWEAQTVGQVVQSLISDFGGEVAVSQFIEQVTAVDPMLLKKLADLVQQAQEAHNDS